jgi:2-polyprenyl-3-methyl-5-hydroxy-6-metoxy-1,4-benzoquinol methylase
MTDEYPVNLVRTGYDALSFRYRDDEGNDERYAPWLARLAGNLPAGGTVLDLGCGCGIPVARDLTAAGFRVTGVDISDVQVERARKLVPGAEFVRADAKDAGFAPAAFDAVVCLYALIHMPLDDQPVLLRRIAGWLKPGGWLLATAGQEAWTGTEENWLGGSATMWWSQADAGTYAAWIEQAGLRIVEQDVVTEAGGAAHSLFWARRPPA